MVEEVKRLGKVVYVAFFGGRGLSNDLRLASDMFLYFNEFFLGMWKEHLATS